MRWTFILFIFLFSCAPELPKDVLPPAKMQFVLWDVMRADEAAGYYAAVDSTFSRLEKHAGYYQTVFNLHKTDEQTFKRSMKFYMEHPPLFKPILDSLHSNAERLKKQSDTTSKYIAPPDSIKKIN